MDELKHSIESGVVTPLYSQSGNIYFPISILTEVSTGFIAIVESNCKHYAAKVGYLTMDDPNKISPYQKEKSIYDLISRAPQCNQLFLCLYDVVETPEQNIGILILDLMDSTVQREPVHDTEMIDFFHTMLRALAFLHQRDINHNDSHYGNVFRCGTKFKLGDFGEGEIHPSPRRRAIDVKKMGRLLGLELYHLSPWKHNIEDEMFRLPFPKNGLPQRQTTNLLMHMLGATPDDSPIDTWTAQQCLTFFDNEILPHSMS
jgi:serine/threonine protein kinase